MALQHQGPGPAGLITEIRKQMHRAIIDCRLHTLFAKWASGDVAGARKVNARLLESFAYETGDDTPNPIPTKVMMNHLGLNVGEARLPMGPPPAGLAQRAAEVMANLVAARRS